MQRVIDHMYGFMAATSHLRGRRPAEEDWAAARAITDELDYPCKVVMKAQDQGHWFMSDGVHRVAGLYLHLKDKVDADGHDDFADEQGCDGTTEDPVSGQAM